MKKKTWEVIIFLAVVVAGFLVYQLVVKDGGIVKYGYNALAARINNIWQSAWGTSDNVMAYWGGQNTGTSINVDDDDSNIQGAMDNAVD